MQTAIDPNTGHPITAKDYLAYWGNRPLGAVEDIRPAMICAFCGQEQRHRAGKTSDTSGHFAHKPNSGFCPTKAPAALPYGRLTPTNPDPVRAREIRATALYHWKWLFKEISDRCPNFDTYEFISLIKVIDKDGLWGYRNLTLRQVPELLLVIRDFTPATSKFRKYWYRFWFSANIVNIDDLWITPPNEVRLIRATFPAPQRRRTIPNPDDILSVKILPHIDGIYTSINIREFAVKTIPEALSIKEWAE